MAIWGSLIGGMIGFSLGGPFGMLLGSLLGGKISRARATSRFGAAAQGQKVFALSLIVLSDELTQSNYQWPQGELLLYQIQLQQNF